MRIAMIFFLLSSLANAEMYVGANVTDRLRVSINVDGEVRRVAASVDEFNQTILIHENSYERLTPLRIKTGKHVAINNSFDSQLLRITVKFNAIEGHLVGAETSRLVSNIGSGQFFDSPSGHYEFKPITGNYEIVGPTETVSGKFQFDPSWSNGLRNIHDMTNHGNYPNDFLVGMAHNQPGVAMIPENGMVLFDGTIGGSDFFVSLAEIDIDDTARPTSWSALHAENILMLPASLVGNSRDDLSVPIEVPEPNTTAVICFSFVLVAMGRGMWKCRP